MRAAKDPPSLSNVLSAYGQTCQSPIHQIWAAITKDTTNLHHFNKLEEYVNYLIKNVVLKILTNSYTSYPSINTKKLHEQDFINSYVFLFTKAHDDMKRLWSMSQGIKSCTNQNHVLLNEKDCSQNIYIFAINDLKKRFNQELKADAINHASVQSKEKFIRKRATITLIFKMNKLPADLKNFPL